MSLPQYQSESGLRALDAKSGRSHDAKTTVLRLSKLPPPVRHDYFHNAVLWDCGNVVRCLLEAQVPVESFLLDEAKQTALMIASRQGCLRALKVLLAAGASHTRMDACGFNALGHATYGGNISCMKALLAGGADPNAADWLGNTCLFDAIMRKQTECVKELLPVADLSIRNRDGKTALHVCVCTASEECFPILLPAVDDVDIRTTTDGQGGRTSETALHNACSLGQQPMAKALLKRGADRMARDSLQGTPLQCAAGNGSLSCAVLLLGRPDNPKMTPAEVSAANVFGLTALHFATMYAHEAVCGVLIQAGARLDAKDSEGCTPLTVARRLYPTNAALHALLSGAGPAQPPGTVCNHCGKTAEQASVRNLKECADCRMERYCGSACQAAAWRGHKATCGARKAEREVHTAPRTKFKTPNHGQQR